MLAVADALDIAGKAESGLIGIPPESNGRGLRDVGCVAGLGPGLTDADPPSGDGTGALFLFEADATEADMEGAPGVVAFARFRTEALDSHADVVFPAPVYAEKEGTVTHPDGRIQRVRQALGHRGESRPGWSVLADTGARSSSAVTALIADAVPLYAGITLDEIGGDGIRWQKREAASELPEAPLSTEPLPRPPSAPDGLVLASAPTLWSGPGVEQSPSRRFLSTEPRALLSVQDARRLGVADGDDVELRQNGGSVRAIAIVRTAVPTGSAFLSPPALAEGPVEVRAPEAALA